MNFQIESLDPAQAHEKYPLLAELWNRALPPERAISAASVRFNLLPSIGVRRLLLLATTAEEGAVGFAIASALQGEPKVTPRGQGWLEALAVLPEQQGQGVGSTLLHHAESWLAAQHCAAAAVGGGPRPFCPGLPDRDELPPFWAHRAYQARGTVWDLAANLATYTPPPHLREPPCAVRPARTPLPLPTAQTLGTAGIDRSERRPAGTRHGGSPARRWPAAPAQQRDQRLCDRLGDRGRILPSLWL